ncbi:MAG: hypothetical protein IJA43_05615, partial [Clostridia bacterium]|nr:hypothetical protein [Clostridia bacterium]
GGKIEDFDGGRDKVLNGSYLSLSLANARQLPRQREQKNKHIKQLDKLQITEQQKMRIPNYALLI